MIFRERGSIGQTGVVMSGRIPAALLAGAFALCLCTATFGSGAVAEAPTHGGYIINSSTSDLMRAHNERVLVIFGASIQFKRYFLVGLLDQCMTVATDVSGVRYNMRETGREKTLVID